MLCSKVVHIADEKINRNPLEKMDKCASGVGADFSFLEINFSIALRINVLVHLFRLNLYSNLLKYFIFFLLKKECDYVVENPKLRDVCSVLK